MLLTDAQIFTWLSHYILPLVRISAFFFAVPLIGEQLVPARVRILLSIAITLLIVPTLPMAAEINPFSMTGILAVVNQVIIGLAMGFLVQIFFQIFALAGQLIALQNGLGLSVLLDPANGIQVNSLSQFFVMMANLLYLVMNGHLVLIQKLAESFISLPVENSMLSTEHFYTLAAQGSWLFESAVLISLPAMLALLLMNLSFGVMARVAPQLNIFNMGFPLMLVFGLLIVWLGLHSFLPEFNQLAEEHFSRLNNLLIH